MELALWLYLFVAMPVMFAVAFVWLVRWALS